MPSLHDHLRQAESNEQSAIDCQSTYPDWTVTKCFYAAIHYIEAYSIYKGHDIYAMYEHLDVSPHAKRSHYVTDITVENKWSEDFSAFYKKLERASKKARYLEKINSTAIKHFKIGSGHYIEILQFIKHTLDIESIKTSTSHLTVT